MMAELTTMQTLQTDTWMQANWSQFVATAYSETYQNGQAYYDNGQIGRAHV